MVNQLFDEMNFTEARKNFQPDSFKDIDVQKFTRVDRFGDEIDSQDEDKFSFGSDEYKESEESDDEIAFPFIDPKTHPDEIA